MWRASPGPPLRQRVRGRYQGSSGLRNAMRTELGGETRVATRVASERPGGSGYGGLRATLRCDAVVGLPSSRVWV